MAKIKKNSKDNFLEKESKELVKYTKEQLVLAKKHQNFRDIIEVVVNKGELVTLEEMETRVNEFLNREVK